MSLTLHLHPRAVGGAFSMADCSAAPALFYAELAMPFRTTHKNTAAYLDRLMARPSYARALKEAEPYFDMFPMEIKPRIGATGEAQQARR